MSGVLYQLGKLLTVDTMTMFGVTQRALYMRYLVYVRGSLGVGVDFTRVSNFCFVGPIFLKITS